MSGRGKPDLSVTQLVAAGLATVTAAFGASYLGVAGTVVGAAVMSVVSTGGAALYKHYLDRGKNEIIDRMPTLGNRPSGEGEGEGEDDYKEAPAEHTRLDLGSVADVTRLDLPAVTDIPKAEDIPKADKRQWPRWYVLAGGAALVFAVVIGGIAAVEGLTGKPVGGASGRLFGDNGDHQSNQNQTNQPAPTDSGSDRGDEHKKPTEQPTGPHETTKPTTPVTPKPPPDTQKPNPNPSQEPKAPPTQGSRQS